MSELIEVDVEVTYNYMFETEKFKNGKHKKVWSGGLHHPLCASVLSMFYREYFSKIEIFVFLKSRQ
jgi:hypothetical protein